MDASADHQTGYSLIELMFVASILATTAAAASPSILASIDDVRALGAVRYMSGTLQQVRMEAVVRHADVGLRFVPVGNSYTYGVYVDGNGNGVRSTDIQSGTDRQVRRTERL